MTQLLFSQTALRFNRNKTFKIVQFTDLHLDLRTDKYPQTIKTMQTVLEKEKPDFIVITGDLIWAEPARTALLTAAKPIVDSNIPWTITFGNHDVEFEITKQEIFLF